MAAAAARARWRLLALPMALFLAIGSSRGLVSPDAAPKPPVPKAISDLRDAIVKGLGFQSEDLKVTGFDVRDALVGQAVAYEFDMEVGKKAVPVRLLEDVNRWDFVDLPIFRSQADADDDTALAEIGRGPISPPLIRLPSFFFRSGTMRSSFSAGAYVHGRRAWTDASANMVMPASSPAGGVGRSCDGIGEADGLDSSLDGHVNAKACSECTHHPRLLG